MKRSRSTQLHELLPREIMLDIFSKLSISHLYPCRFVCKDWFNLIRDPLFVNLRPSCLLLLAHTHTHPPNKHPSPSFLIFDTSDHENNLPTPFNSFLYPTDFNIPSSPWIEIVGSCNGLLCLKLICEPVSFYIYNPITRETLKLPKTSYRLHLRHNERCSISCAAGFAFDAVTHTYKVFCLWDITDITLDNQDPETQLRRTAVEIFTLGSLQWRRLEDVAACIRCQRLKKNQVPVNVNGALHWQLLLNNHCLYAMDITTEELKSLEMPTFKYSWRTSLMSLRESLCVVNDKYHDEVELWTMKDYGVATSWTKEYVFRRELLGPLKTSPFNILSTTMEKQQIVLLVGDEHQGYYDLEKKEFEPIMIDEIPKRSLSAVIHYGSLISPNTLTLPATQSTKEAIKVSDE